MKHSSSIALRLLPTDCKRILPLLLLLAMAFGLSAQRINWYKADSTVEHSIIYTIEGLPKPLTLNGDTLLHPYYSFLWIFGDGHFINGTKQKQVQHRYDVPRTGKDSIQVKAYSTNTYSGGDPPPMLSNPDIILNQDDLDSSRSDDIPVISDGALHLQRHREIRPGDSLVNILSFRNASREKTLNGQLYLFYNSPISTKKLKTTDGQFSSVKSKDFAEFDFQESLIYYDNVDPKNYQLDRIPSALGKHFEKAIVLDYKDLIPGKEQHLFFAFANDSTLATSNATERKEVQFLALMTSSADSTSVLSKKEEEHLGALGVFNFIDSISQPVKPATGQESLWGINAFKGKLATNIVDAFTMNAQLVSAYAPSTLRVDACQCPSPAPAKQLFFTLDIQNDQDSIADQLIIDVVIPKEIDFASISDTLVRFSMENRDTADLVSLHKDEETRTISWTLSKLHLLPTSQKGYGDPSTQAQIVFSALTEGDIDLKTVPELRACIRFSETADAICTLPATVAPISTAIEDTMLVCEACNCAPDQLWIWWTIGSSVPLLAFLIWLFRYIIGRSQRKNQVWIREEKERVVKFS